MTHWTALLESLHSALIDEISQRHPDPKPELGLPSRHAEWSLPKQAGPRTQILVQPVLFGSAQGMGVIALEPDAAEKLGLTPEELWTAMLKRAGGEFMRRNIQPRLGASSRLKPGDPLPKGLQAPSRLIWFPIRIGGAGIYYGIGV